METPNKMPDQIVEALADLARKEGYRLTYLEMYYYEGSDKYKIQVGDSPFVLDKGDKHVYNVHTN